MSKLALFDFDGTITTKDTMAALAQYQEGKTAYLLALARLSPVLIQYKLKLIPNTKAKTSFLTYFFGGLQEEQFNRLCQSFANEIIPGLIRPGALKKIEALKKANYRVTVVSASAENWVKPWTEKYSLDLLASTLEVQNNLITGKLVGENCYGEEKVRRLKNYLDINQYEEIQAYGDTSGDLPMLKMASENFSFYKPFR